MMHKLIKSAAITLIVATVAFGKVGAELHGIKGDHEHAFMKVLEAMESKGYVLSDPHERINDGYKTKYGTETLDNLGFFSTAHDEKLRDIINAYPKIGGFSPFNMHIYMYSKKSELYDGITWYGHVKPETMADIVGLKDKKLREDFVRSFDDLDKLAKDMLKPTETKVFEYDKLPAKPMMEFTVAFEGEVGDFAEEFQEKWEGAFEDHAYIVAGYKNFKEAYDDMGKPINYDAYWVYSLCHFEFSNGVFQNRADSGIFAPCAVYMYVKPGEKVLHIGMPLLENWIVVNGITNKKHIAAIRAIDAEIIEIFTNELNAKKVN